MALLDYQYSLGGVVFGAGTVYVIERVTGLGLGGKRPKVFSNPGEDGQQWGREYRDGNTLTFEGHIRCRGAGKDAAAYAAMLTLRAAFDGSNRTGTKATQPLGWKMPGQPEASIDGRPDKFDPVLEVVKFGIIPFSATFDTAAPLDV